MLDDAILESSESSCAIVNYFEKAAGLAHGEYPTAPRPFRTFSAGTSAFHLNNRAAYKIMTIDNVSKYFGLPDLRCALLHYMRRYTNGKKHIPSVGDRRPVLSAQQLLPFNKVQVWTWVRIQTVSYFPPHRVLSPETLEAVPPSKAHPNGKYNSVLVNVDPRYNWPQSGITGESAC